MSLHVIVGAGPVGTATAQRLVELGHDVRIVTRSGGGPDHPAIERVAADAADAGRLTHLTAGAAALYNCANPPYHQWLTDWPPLALAMRTAAMRSGAVLVTAGNLYPYGPVDAPMTEATPQAATHPKLALRGQLWRDDLAAHEAGRLRTTEVRASDYLEANSILSLALAKPILAGKRAYVPTPLDVPHSWTAIRDVARMLTTVALDDRAWGRAWHVPTNPPLTVRELAEQAAQVAGAPRPKLTSMPYAVLWAGGLVNPFVKELRTTRYQFARPFVLDSTLATATFGVEPTPMAESLQAALALTAEPAGQAA